MPYKGVFLNENSNLCTYTCKKVQFFLQLYFEVTSYEIISIVRNNS